MSHTCEDYMGRLMRSYNATMPSFLGFLCQVVKYPCVITTIGKVNCVIPDVRNNINFFLDPVFHVLKSMQKELVFKLDYNRTYTAGTSNVKEGIDLPTTS
jgi:hypothetical protein